MLAEREGLNSLLFFRDLAPVRTEGGRLTGEESRDAFGELVVDEL